MKTVKQLNGFGYQIDRKKIRRPMSENNHLNHSYNKRKPVTRVMQSVFDVALPDKLWELDIKYIWIHEETRNGHLLATIDCYSREAADHYFWYHCLKKLERDYDGST